MKKKPPGTPKMSDVAAAAGVALSTVSRVLTKPGRINGETELRVLEAVRRLGYIPNAAARNLRVGSSKMVLVVLPRIPYLPFFSEVLRGIDTELTAAGYGLIMGNLDGVRDKEEHIANLAFANRIDGVLLLSDEIPALHGRSIADAAIPLVSLFVDFTSSRIPSIVVDDGGGMSTLTQHLVDLGHKRFLFVGGPEGNYYDERRFEGFRDCLWRAGLAAGRVARIHTDFMLAGGAEAGRFLLAMKPRPTAVVCCNDELAISCIKVARQGGLRVPEDVSVVGFDGIPVSEYCEPSLTTIVQPRAEIGAKGTRLLLDRIAGGARDEVGATVLQGRLVVRESTGTPPRGAPRGAAVT